VNSDPEEIFSGKLLHLVKLESKYECVIHPGAVVVLPVLNDGGVVLVRQFRPAVNDFILELPAGLLEPGEEPIETGRRELLEETGYRCNKIEIRQKFFTTPGYSNEELFLCLASGLEFSQPVQEEGLEEVIMDKKEIKEGLQKGIFNDAKTIIGLQMYLQEFEQC